jgi:hypothetical protein
VTFVDFDGTELSKQTINEGADAVAPPDPERAGYVFVGWDRPFTNVTSNLTVKATYEPLPTYTVTFVDHSGTPILAQTVTEGDSATPPVPPVRQGYTFTGWDKSFDNVTSSFTVTAIYVAIPPTTYTVTFVDFDDAVLSTQSVTSGDSAVAPPDPVRASYTFTGWDKSFDNVTSNFTVRATYAVIPLTTYTVTFVDFDDTIISTQSVIAGTNATAPLNPIRVGYVFVGWDKSFTNVTSNLIVKATYVTVSPITYTVTYVCGDHGNFTPQVTSGLLAGDATPQPPQIDTVTSWRFIGWQPALAPYVTGNVTYTAQWELVTAPPDLSIPTTQPDLSVPSPRSPIIVNVPAQTVTVPDQNITVTAPSSASDDTKQTQGNSSSANTTAANDTDASDTQTALPDEQAPLAGGTNTTDEGAGPNLLIILSALLFLVVMAVGGWLLLKRARY